jgi:hypothetical protein
MTPRSKFFSTAVRGPNGWLYFWRSRLEEYKAELGGLPVTPFNGVDSLVAIGQAAVELGCVSRTIKRRIIETRAAANSTDRAA